MTYQRITADIRDSILDRLKDQFTPRFDELGKLEHDVAEKAYAEMMGSDAIQMVALPEGWLPTSSSITVCPERKRADYYESFSFAHPKRFKADKNNYYDSPSAQLLEFCKSYTADKAQAHTDRKEALSEARRVIESVTTLNKLIEVWPEMASVIRDIGEEPNPTKQVPAKILDQLNAKLRLPVGEGKSDHSIN